MLFSKFRTQAKDSCNPPAPTRSVPPGIRVYAIGDVHGRLDLLRTLTAQILADISSRGDASNHIVLLGDLIDRGPDSRGVLEFLRTFSGRAIKLHLLTGNHEEVLLRLLNGEKGILWSWLKFGGLETLTSYGVNGEKIRLMGEVEALAIIKAGIPQAHQSFLQEFADTIRVGDYLFVHAGIQPGIELGAQGQKDLRWIREPFLSDNSDHGFFVVHGHTISDEVVERANRIGIDTGAYSTGRLTALALEGEQRWFLEATG